VDVQSFLAGCQRLGIFPELFKRQSLEVKPLWPGAIHGNGSSCLLYCQSCPAQQQATTLMVTSRFEGLERRFWSMNMRLTGRQTGLDNRGVVELYLPDFSSALQRFVRYFATVPSAFTAS